jgi:uncharacterized protein
MKRYIIFTLLSLIIFVGCRTINITESDAFDPNRTITPQTFDIQPYQLHDITLETEDGESLDAWFLERDDAAATLIYYGGNDFLMVTSRALIESYRQIPVNILLFDYRGYGRSSGEPTVSGVMTDARTAYNYARNDAPNRQESIYVHGHSMGSFLSATITEEEEIAGYILESPISDVNQWTRRLIPWIARPFIRFNIDDPIKEQSNLDRVSRIDKPLLIMGGSNDEVTPFRMAEDLYEASVSSQKRLVKIAGGTHNDLPKSVEYRNALQDFFSILQ